MTIEIIKVYKAGNTWGAVYTINGNRAASLFAGADAPTAESIAAALGICKELSTEEKAIEFGGKLWEKHGHRRIYINKDDMIRAIGLEVERFKTGNIRRAKLNGETISNNQANKIIRQLGWSAKVWYDCNSKSWGHKDISEDLAYEISYAIESL